MAASQTGTMDGMPPADISGNSIGIQNQFKHNKNAVQHDHLESADGH